MSARAIVLIVDDEPGVVRAVGRILRGRGHSVLEAGSGAEALAIVARERVDVMITDLRMPGMGGLELLAQAKQANPALVSLVLSASVGFYEAQRAINEGGAFRYLTKPCDHHDILSALDGAVDEAQKRRQLHEAEQRRQRVLSAQVPLRQTKPELFVVSRESDAYVIDEARVRKIVARLEPSELRTLLSRTTSGSEPALADPTTPSCWGPAL